MAEGRSALADLGYKTFPVGTKDELEQAGLDINKVSCCARPVKDGVRGCPVWELCRFDHKNMGGFKGEGPRYIGYRVIDPQAGDLGSNQGVHLCHAFIAGLQKRADFGAAARRESGGRKGEVIRVIKQEGEEIEIRHNLPINGKGEVINVMPEMIEALKSNEVKFSLLPNEVSVGRRDFILKQVVPHFQRLNETGGESFAQRLAMMDLEVDMETRQRIDYAASPPTDEMSWPGAEVVKRGPGRPRKVRDEEAS